MPWNVRDYPASMKNLDPLVRKKAIDIANALLADGYSPMIGRSRSPRVKQKNGMTMQMKRRRKLFRKKKIRKKTMPIKPIRMRKN